MADAHKNFATSLVATAPSPATSGTSLVVTGADGTKFPAAPFNATIWPAGVQPTTANAEIVRVTAISTDTFTIVRQQEGTSARTVVVGDQISANITGKTLNDVEKLLTGITGGSLTASTDFVAVDTLEISATDTLEIPATSTLEILVYASLKSAYDTQQYLANGHFDYVESGCFWTPDSAGASLAGTMTPGYIWIGGKRLTVAGVKSRSFTASKDTYVDAYDAGNGTATLVYTETTNNVSTGAPILPIGSIRLAIIVSAAGSIASTASVNQGQETMIVPIVSSVPYSVQDSLGNLICPRDPTRRLLGYRQVTSNGSAINVDTAIAAFASCPVILPQIGRKVKVTAYTPFGNGSTSGDMMQLTIKLAASQVQMGASGVHPATGGIGSINAEYIYTPTIVNPAFTVTYQRAAGTGTLNYTASATSPAFMKIELE